MKTKKTSTLLIILLISLSTFAQTYTIKGTVTDSIGEPLVGATAVLLTAKDSMLTYFTSADERGAFEINRISKGNYIFQASYTSYNKQEESIDLTGTNKVIDKGIIKLEKIAYNLKTVEIEGERVPVQFINDTLIYDALAFDPGKNTTVEDLLKKMPGIEVDEKGDIKAQGKKVQKVTVDGKEFFGNDPKMATQNLPAEAVKKVKVFDKKSDFSETTGIDDGKEEKTIDLELKEDHKNGIFGKVTAGYGTENTYLGKANINKFSPKIRISLISKTNNTSKEGFGYNEFAKMSGGFSELFNNDGGFNIEDYFGQKEGIFKVFDAGININYTPQKDLEINTSYFLNKNNSFTLKDDIKQNFIPGFIYKSQSNSNKTNELFGHNINALLKYKLNKNSKIKWKIQLKNNSSESENIDTLSNYNENILANYQESINSRNLNGNNIFSYLTYSTKLKKEGRVIFTKISGNYSDNDGFNNTNSLNRYYKDSVELDIDSIYQEHQNKTKDIKFSGSLAYTEPLGNKIYLIADVRQENNNNKYDKNLYNRFPDIGENTNSQDIYNSEFNHSDVKLSFKYNGIKHQFDIGLKYQYSTQTGDYVTENKGIKRTYKNFLPNMNYSYKFSQHADISIKYSSRINAPSILQLMPIVDNSNPQYIVLGNEKLEPEKSNGLRLNYYNYNSFDNTSIGISLSGSIIENTIVNSRDIDELFRTTSKPINLGQSERASLFSHYSIPFKLIKSAVTFGVGGFYRHSNTVLNSIKNDYKQFNYRISFDIHNYKNKYLTGKIGVNYKNTITKYSVNKESENTYNRIKYFTNIKWKVTKNVKFNNKISYRNYSNQLSSNKDNEVLWDASLLFFLQDKRYTIKLAVVDILNQSLGYNQSNGDNYIQYIKTNRIGRYFMLSLTYSLSKFKAPEEGGIIIFND